MCCPFPLTFLLFFHLRHNSLYFILRHQYFRCILVSLILLLWLSLLFSCSPFIHLLISSHLFSLLLFFFLSSPFLNLFLLLLLLQFYFLVFSSLFSSFSSYPAFILFFSSTVFPWSGFLVFIYSLLFLRGTTEWCVPVTIGAHPIKTSRRFCKFSRITRRFNLFTLTTTFFVCSQCSVTAAPLAVSAFAPVTACRREQSGS